MLIRRLASSIVLLSCSVVAGLRFESRHPDAVDDELLAARGDARPQVSSIVEDAAVKTLAKSGSTWETTLAISPVNSRVAVTSAMHWQRIEYQGDIYVTRDGGVSWTAITLPTFVAGEEWNGHADPVIACDRTGTIYLATLSRWPVPESPTRSALWLWKSTDDGRSWNVASQVTRREAPTKDTLPFDDKEWIAVDRSGSRFSGRVYLVYMHTESYTGGNRRDMTIVHSADGGSTWSEPQVLATASLSLLAVGPDGEVYVTYLGSRGYVVRRSDDGGDTFGEEHYVGSPQIPGASEPLPNANFRVPATQAMVVDESNGASRGYLYYAWHAGAASSSPSGSFPVGVWFRRSVDGGVTWSAPRLMSTHTHDAVLPTLSVDRATGELVMTWLDRRDDPTNTNARLYAAHSLDGGETFDAPRAFSAPFSLNGTRTFIGHYNASSSEDGRHLATFADAGGYMSVARITFDDSPTISRPRHRPVRP